MDRLSERYNLRKRTGNASAEFVVNHKFTMNDLARAPLLNYPKLDPIFETSSRPVPQPKFNVVQSLLSLFVVVLTVENVEQAVKPPIQPTFIITRAQQLLRRRPRLQ